jgi:hypothetical protein
LNRKRVIAELLDAFDPIYSDHFPNISSQDPLALLGIGIEVIKPRTSAYNCYAYALGVFNKWLYLNDFSPIPGDALFLMTSRYMFLPTAMDFDFNSSVRKIVFYEKNGEPAHAALRVKSGWKSKLGRCCLMFHPSLEMLAGGLYGQPVHMFQKELGR